MDQRAHGLRELLQKLVSIESTNPDLVPGGTGESAIADAASAWLQERDPGSRSTGWNPGLGVHRWWPLRGEAVTDSR